MRVAVTGASGFVGRSTCQALVAGGHEVTAVLRAGDAPAAARVVRVAGLDERSLQAGFAACDAVVHLAARVHVTAEDTPAGVASFEQVNVGGTATALRVARQVGARVFIYISTIKVNGEGREAPYTEHDPAQPAGAYARSKRDAEELVRGTRGLRTVILRPPLVYGPGVGGNFRRLLRLAALSRRIPVPFGGLNGRRSLIYVDNLASVISTALAHPECEGTYLVADAADLDFTTLLQQLARSMGGRSRLFAMPRVLRRGAALLGREADLHRLTGTLRVDASRFRALGWASSVGLEDALGRTAAWWMERR